MVVYCTNPTEGVSLRTGSIATAVGNPVMCAASTKIIPGTSVPLRLIVLTCAVLGISSPLTLNVRVDEYPEPVAVTDVPGIIFVLAAHITGFPTAVAILPVLRDTPSVGFVQ